MQGNHPIFGYEGTVQVPVTLGAVIVMICIDIQKIDTDVVGYKYFIKRILSKLQNYLDFRAAINNDDLNLILSRNDIMLPQQILDWNNLSLNWDEIIKENMENTIKQKEAQKKQ